MGRVAVKVDCDACDQTGYENYYTEHTIPAYYRPGAVKRMDQLAGGVVYLGECSIKISIDYASLIARSMFLEFNDIRWNFTRMSDPGVSMGQARIVLALSRKA